uniref:Uncharacterized protein n=1 Tax=Onchocerca volvulus TaxID=6282 RepID=A0A8R1Y053_ONCVO
MIDLSNANDTQKLIMIGVSKEREQVQTSKLLMRRSSNKLSLWQEMLRLQQNIDSTNIKNTKTNYLSITTTITIISSK